MPKQYVLKNPIISKEKVDRLLKTIKDNSESDRIEASELLTDIKNQLQGIDLSSEDGLDGYVKLVNTALNAISQMGNANDKLLKLTGIIQKFLQTAAKDGDSEGLGKAAGSFFSQLTALSNKKDDEDD